MNQQIIVSKLGSSLIANKTTGLHSSDINAYVKQIVAQNSDSSHIFVVSGARAMGIFKAGKLFKNHERETLSDKQLAGMGATEVFYAFEQALEKVGIASSSYPVTHHLLQGAADPETIAERESFIDVLRGNAQAGIVSVINEADAMNDKELMSLLFGYEYEIDNDLLAAHIARAVGANKLTLWKKEGGLRDDQGAYIKEINNENLEGCQRQLSARVNGEGGRGGPATTLEALVLASKGGVMAEVTGVSSDMSGVHTTRVVVG